MDFSKAKISTLVLTLSLGIFCKATRRSLLGYHITDRSGDVNPIISDCICLPNIDNGHLIPDLIDSERKSLERLVVYFYIDPQTQKITAYTPNTEKQQIFPDVSFDTGDNMVPILPDESINSIVIQSPNKIAENAVVGHDSINYNLNIDDTVHDSILSIPHEIRDTEIDSIEIPKYEENIIESTNNDYTIQSPVNNADLQINSNGNIEVIDNINLETSNEENIIQNLFPPQKTDTKHQEIIQTPLNNVLDGWQTSEFNNVYKWNDKVNDIYSQPVESPKNIQESGFLKFDQWFQQQMDSAINKEAQNDVNFPDDAVLKNLIYKYLFQNGVLIMDNGILKTSEGHTLNLSNLKLQPVLVGLSLGYNYPIPGIGSKISPPYFDAMVLSMEHPQKVLGIIPISPNYRPNSIGYNTMIPGINKLIPSVVSSTLLKTQCTNNKCYTIAKDFPFRRRMHEKKKATQKDAQVTHGRSAQQPANHKVHMKIYRGAANPLDLFNIKQLESSHNQRKSKGFPVLNDLLNNIYKILLSDETSRIAGQKTPEYDVHTIEEERPDFRIVGGSAATGSGTPVSSRGRSAFE